MKSLLKTWLTLSEGNLEDFEQLLSYESTQITEEVFEYGEIDTAFSG